jgi:hypothetical protein
VKIKETVCENVLNIGQGEIPDAVGMSGGGGGRREGDGAVQCK